MGWLVLLSLAITLVVCFFLRLNFALGAIVGLLHDVSITLGLLSIMGVEIDLNVMAALLTLVGYSLNDTIIVYDRLRENLRAAPGLDMAGLINRSVNQTLSRTILTSGTTLLATLSLFLLGGGVIHDFALTMVQAFAYIERNDFARAEAAFRAAAVLTPSPALQSWNEFFLARLAEEQGQFSSAIEQYSQIWRVMPHWREVKYREIVCQVKMGFCEPVLDQLITLIRDEPAYFNRALVDPALERGRLLILSALYDLWAEAKKCAEADRERINAVGERLDAWFAPEHPVQLQLGGKIRELEDQANVNNYLAYLKVVEERPGLEKELDDCISREVEDLRNRYKYYLDILQEIRDEASWFPFPAALREFSHEFNESAGIINRAFSCNFKEPEAFKRAQGETPHLAELLRSLRKRLHFLRMVRDGTLFGLTLLKTFIWVEAVGLLLCFISVPVIYFWGESMATPKLSGVPWVPAFLTARPFSMALLAGSSSISAA